MSAAGPRELRAERLRLYRTGEIGRPGVEPGSALERIRESDLVAPFPDPGPELRSSQDRRVFAVRLTRQQARELDQLLEWLDLDPLGRGVLRHVAGDPPNGTGHRGMLSTARRLRRALRKRWAHAAPGRGGRPE